jgi:hypothetical protein
MTIVTEMTSTSLTSQIASLHTQLNRLESLDSRQAGAHDPVAEKASKYFRNYLERKKHARSSPASAA